MLICCSRKYSIIYAEEQESYGMGECPIFMQDTQPSCRISARPWIHSLIDTYFSIVNQNAVNTKNKVEKHVLGLTQKMYKTDR